MQGPDYQAVFKQSPIPSVLIRKDRVVVDANLVFLEHFGLEPHHLAGKSFPDSMHELSGVWHDVALRLRQSLDMMFSHARPDCIVLHDRPSSGLDSPPMQLVLSPITDVDGNVQCVLLQLTPGVPTKVTGEASGPAGEQGEAKRVPSAPADQSVSRPDAPAGSILLVESRDALRHEIAEMLAQLGYVVHQADGKEKAWNLLSRYGSVDLIVAGTGAQPRSALELARQATASDADIDVLLISDAPDLLTQHASPDDGTLNVLQRPYMQEELAARVRHLTRNREQRVMLRDATGMRPDASGQAARDSVLSRFGALRILLVEDTPETLHATTELLEMLGHSVTSATNAEDALNALAEKEFDVMCSDIELPGMSGQELARQVRRDYPQVGIVFASGRMPGAQTDAAQLDAVVLLKPYRVSDLENALETAMLAR